MNAFWLIYNLDKQAKDQGLQDNSEHEMETTCPVLKPDDEISAGEHMSEDAVKGWLQQYHWTKKRIYPCSKFGANLLQMPHLLRFVHICYVTVY